jgi:hypothetical protein
MFAGINLRDRCHGFEKENFPFGHTYHGEFVDGNLVVGRGIIRYPNGTSYEYHDSKWIVPEYCLEKTGKE